MRNLEIGALAVILLAATSSQTPPTADGLVNPHAYHSVWNVRIARANVIEILFVALLALWGARAAASSRAPVPTAVLPVLAASLGLAAIELLDLIRHGLPHYLFFDFEHLVVLAMGFVLVRFAIRTRTAARAFAVGLGLVLAAHAAELVLVHGVLGSTKFGTSTGRMAVLITEDSLLLIIPTTLLWGALVAGRFRRRAAVGWVIAFTLVVALVELLSLRRGALLFIVAAVVIVVVSHVSRRTLMRGVGWLAAILAVAAIAGPGRPLVHDLSYTISSTVLQTRDSSTSQRTTELKSFGVNVDGFDWLFGKGLGAPWYAPGAGPTDIASFGAGETAYTRIGWHVYGLDWLYKFGILGVLAVALGIGVTLAIARERARAADRAIGWMVTPLAVMIPVFILLLFTNLRIGFFGGVLAGLLDVIAGQAPGRPGSAGRQRPPAAADEAPQSSAY